MPEIILTVLSSLLYAFLAYITLGFVHGLLANGFAKYLGIPFSRVGCALIPLLALLSGIALHWLGAYSMVFALLINTLWQLFHGFLHKRRLTRRLDRLSSKECEHHPFGSQAEWIFAVSRRFGIEEVDSFYQDHLSPLLDKAGVAIECRNASAAVTSPDYWVNRFNVVLEFASIHILIEHNKNANVRLEQLYSKKLRSQDRAKARIWHIPKTYDGIDLNPGVAWPYAIVISEKRKRDKVDLALRESIISVPDLSRLTDFEDRFMHHLSMAKKVLWLAWLRDHRIITFISERTPSSDSDAVVEEFFEVSDEALLYRSRFAQRLADQSDSVALRRFLEEHDYPEEQLTQIQARNRLNQFRLGLLNQELVIPGSFRETYKYLHDLVFLTAWGQKSRISSLYAPLLLLGTTYVRLRYRASIKQSPDKNKEAEDAT